MSDQNKLTNDVAADLERLICDLADIGSSTDVDARRKAKRLYTEMRLKYPVSVQDAVEPSPVHSEEWLRIHRCPPDVECVHCNPVNRSGDSNA